jgi:hypothetical protein
MKILLRLIFLIAPMIVVALAVTLILGIPIKLFGRNLDSVMFITVVTTLWGFYQAFMNKNSPHRLALAYLDFLEGQGITTKRPLILRLILRAAWHKFNVVRDPRFKLLEELGVEAFSVHEIPKDTVVRARNLTLVSIAVFAPPESGLRADACKEAACDNGAVHLAFAYLDLSWDSAKVTEEGTREFKLSELPRLAPDRLKLRSTVDGQGRRRRFELEIEQIKSILSQGRWPRSLSEILQAIYDTGGLSRKGVDLVEFLRTHSWVREALQRLFKNLPTAAIERYLASRQFNAYLLSFAAGRGAKIAAPLDVLVDPKWKGEPYLFERYTPNTRIGLVPRGKKLDEFAAQLEADLPKAIAVAGTDPPRGGEIILHRMGLSGRDYYRVKLPRVEQRKAITKLRELLARGIEPPDIISVLEHSEKPDELLARIIESPLQDLAGPLDPAEKANLERAGDTLRAALRAALNVTSERELAEQLERKGVLVRQVEAGAQAVSAVLASQEYDWPDDRVRVIVRSYLDTLRDLVALVGLPPAAGKTETGELNTASISVTQPA